jgi:hypothetical protein
MHCQAMRASPTPHQRLMTTTRMVRASSCRYVHKANVHAVQTRTSLLMPVRRMLSKLMTMLMRQREQVRQTSSTRQTRQMTQTTQTQTAQTRWTRQTRRTTRTRQMKRMRQTKQKRWTKILLCVLVHLTCASLCDVLILRKSKATSGSVLRRHFGGRGRFWWWPQ